MADKTTIARPYARAAFEHASAARCLGPWSGALAIAATVVSAPEVAVLLGNPHVASAALADLVMSVVTAAMPGPAPAPDAALGNLIADLAANHRLGVLAQITALFNAMKDEAERTVDVEVNSAAPLADAQRNELAAALEKRLQRKVRLHCTTDPALIGGAVLRAGDLVIDGSLRARLDRFQYELSR